jgi:alkylation response protein AidB-like acyl-CoA dehydrogenase
LTGAAPGTTRHVKAAATPTLHRERDELSPWLELRQLAAGGGTVVPYPGSGGTPARFRALADWGARDLSLARLAEGHLDALAILAEAGREPMAGEIYGVWAARSPAGTTARLAADGWHLKGEKPFCSGSTCLGRALVTAECVDGYRLFEVSVAENVVGVHPGSWPAVGMADSLSETLDFGGPPLPESAVVGPPNFYLDRPGFWFGATGVAACWYGGARGLVDHVLSAKGPNSSDLVAVEVGHAVAHIETMRRLLDQAAAEIDDDPEDHTGEARMRSLVIRHAVHQASQQVLAHVAAAAGAGPLCHDRAQARRAADLNVYMAQYHGPQDANALGHFALNGWSWT